MKHSKRLEVLMLLEHHTATAEDLANKLGYLSASVKNTLHILQRLGYASRHEQNKWQITEAGKQEIEASDVPRRRILQLISQIHDIAEANDIAYVFGVEMVTYIRTSSNKIGRCKAEISCAYHDLTGGRG